MDFSTFTVTLKGSGVKNDRAAFPLIHPPLSFDRNHRIRNGPNPGGILCLMVTPYVRSISHTDTLLHQPAWP